MVINFFSILLNLFVLFIHPYYVSVTEINYNKNDKTLEITSRIFTDDFEKTLLQNYNTKPDLINPKDKAGTEKIVADYLSKKLKIEVNGEEVKLKFLGFEIEEDAVWCYSEGILRSRPASMKIVNSLLYEYKAEQLNLMHVTVDGKRQSDKLQQPETEIVMKF